MKPELVALTKFYGPTLAVLEREYVLHKLWEAKDPAAMLDKIAPTVRGAVTTGLVGYSRKHLEALPKLEIVSCFGTAPGTLDLAAAKERGIVVTNTPDWTVDAVADLGV